MNRMELQKLIDVCRSDADLQLPEMQPLAEQIETDPAVRHAWETSQTQDAAIRRAIRDVPVPSGLEQQLLSALFAADSSVAAALANDLTETDRAVEPDAPIPASSQTPRGWKNWKLWSTTLATVAAVVLLSYAFWPAREPSLATEEDARERVTELLAQVRDHWQSTNQPFDVYPLPLQIPRAQYPWQRVSTSSGALRVVCYDLAPSGAPGRNRARLFVARTQQKTTLSSKPPAQLYPPQGRGWWIAVWKNPQSDSVVYLMALEGGNQQYQNLIRPRSNIAGAGQRAAKVCAAGKV